MKMILWSIHTFWYKGLATKNETRQVRKNGLYSENDSDYKYVFHQRVEQSMKFTFDKCVLNVTPVTHPTQYTKSDKQIIKT